VSGRLWSASWDKTARAWDLSSASCIATLKGHEAALWSVLPVCDTGARVLTAAADRSIKLWCGDKCERSYAGHTDVVRELALLGEAGCFLSCSNDATVRLWQLGGECLRVLRASEAYVYAVSILPTGEWLTCSEDRTVRVWSGASDECVQSIAHPATVWACAPMPNGDIVAGCADGKAYVWTRAPGRCAGVYVQTAFRDEVAAVEMPAQQVEGMVGDLEIAKLASEEALAQPGTREGQHKIVKDGKGTPVLYQWSVASAAWQKIGEVTGSAGGSTLGKRSFAGKEYDYLFDIDINGSMLKLPFNRGQDPWMAAQQWLWANDLDQSFLDQVHTRGHGRRSTLSYLCSASAI
jgi:phospholipase A-2-activating protein